MSKNSLTNRIRNEGSLLISGSTLQVEYLLCRSHDIILANKIRSGYKLAAEIRDLLLEDNRIVKGMARDSMTSLFIRGIVGGIDDPEKQEQASWIWHEDIYDLFQDLAPHGYYFGSHEGNGSDIGWWKEAT